MVDFLSDLMELLDQTDELACHYFGKELKINQKTDQSPVTQADLSIEKRIQEWLETHYPDIGIWGEEWGEVSGTSDIRLIVDPIDGTRNFVRGIPIFATLIGVEQAGELVIGMVSAPAMKRRWWAEKGKGAWVKGVEGTRQMRVSGCKNRHEAQVFYGSLYGSECFGETPEESEGVLLPLLRGTHRQRGWGDFFSHVMVANGSGEYSIDYGLKAWDMAALKVIIEEAGGMASNWNGGFSLLDSSLVCSNGHFHPDLIATLRYAGKDFQTNH